MCGICGGYGPPGVAPDELRAMMDVLAHRGPDDDGLLLDGPVGLGNRRLSIIDIAGGSQPIANEDGTVWVVYNGEIYNHPQLRRRLEQSGHVFKTRADTEVIVHLYEELGLDFVKRLRGMFAIALWDAARERLVLARDHLGQKPLFYTRDADRLWFASEIKGLLRVRQAAPQLNPVALHHYLSLRFIPPPLTMFAGIEKLPPAHLMVVEQGETTLRRYWDVPLRPDSRMTEADALTGLREKLVETVEAHLISDVAVGAFLSGGMDSSVIVALIAQELEQEIDTFAVGVTEQSFDELPYARQVAQHHGTCHHEQRVESDLIRELPAMIWHLDEPSDPIAACQYHAAALAAQHVKVVVGGDGGDELFAGFDRYRYVGQLDRYARLPSFVREGMVGPLLNALPENFSYKSFSQKARWVQTLAREPGLADRYAAATSFFRFSHAQKATLFGPELWTAVGDIRSAAVITDAYRRAPADHPIDRMLYADYQTRLPEHSLVLTDRMTMAHSLELRSPFLDHELVAFMGTMPHQFKIKGRTLKYILRRLGRHYLPREIVQRDKQGFMFPVAFWFRNELHGFIREALLGSPLVAGGLLRREPIATMLDEHRDNRVDHHNRLWMLLNLRIWHQLFIEQADVGDVRAELERMTWPSQTSS